MNNQIFIDGQDFTGFVNGINNLTVTFGLDSTSRTVNTSVTSGLIFIGDAFNYLKDKFFGEDCNDVGFIGRDLEANIIIKVNIPNCTDEYPFIIRGDLLEICYDNCTITSQGVSRTADQEFYNALQSATLRADDFPISIAKCDQFDTFNAFQFLLLQSILVPLLVLPSILLLLGINVIPDFLQDFLDSAVGCEGVARGALMSDIFRGTISSLSAAPTNINGSFSSSILDQGYYSNSTYLSEDTTQVFGATGFQDVTLFPNTFFFDYMNRVKTLFNADFRIKDGVFYVERNDFFFDNSNLLVDIEEVSTANNPVCYRFTDKKDFAKARYSFSEDSVETAGTVAMGEYRDIINWNDPFVAGRVGVNDIDILFAPSHFVGDQFTTNFTANFIDPYRPSGALIVSDSANQAVSLWQLPKVVMITNKPPNPQTELAKVVAKSDVDGLKFNYPFYIGEDNNIDISEPKEELYQNFYFIDDPRNTPVAPYEISEYTFLATAEQINLVVDNGIDVYIKTRFGKGFPNEIDINYQNGTITIKDVKIICDQ